MSNEIKIGVFYSTNKSAWKLLPNISEFLTDTKLVPNRGDRITVIDDDCQLMNNTSPDFANCLTVNEKVFNYNEYDVALVCDYEPF